MDKIRTKILYIKFQVCPKLRKRAHNPKNDTSPTSHNTAMLHVWMLKEHNCFICTL